MTKQLYCVICGKKFWIRIAASYRPLASGRHRMRQSVTCSSKCSNARLRMNLQSFSGRVDEKEKN